MASAARLGSFFALALSLPASWAGAWPASPPTPSPSVRALVDQGHYAAAESLARIQVETSAPEGWTDSLGYARAVDLLVEARIENGHETRPGTGSLADLAVGICDRRADRAPADLAHALDIRSELLGATEAIPLLERGSRLLAGRSAADSLLLVRVLHDLGENYMEVPRITEADSVFRIASAICDRLLPADHPDRAVNLLMQSLPLWSNGHCPEAVAVLKRSAAMMERCVGPDHPRLARFLVLLALRQRFVHDTGAQANFARAIAIDERSLRPDHPELARALMFAAGWYEEIGDFDEAIRLCERSLAIRRRELPPDHPEVAWSLSALGENLLQRGDVARGGALLDSALAIERRVLPPGDLQIGISLRVLGSQVLMMGRPREGLAMMTESEAIYRRYFADNNPDMVYAELHVAEAEIYNGEPRKAADLLRAELPRAVAAQGRDAGLTTQDLHLLAIAEENQGEWREAERDCARALEISQRLFPGTLGPKLLTNERARAEAMLGRPDRVLELLHDVAGGLDSLQNMGQWQLGYAKLLLADALAQKGDSVAALREALASLTVTRKLLLDNLEYFPESLGLQLLGLSTRAVGLSLSLAAGMPEILPDLARATYDAVIRSRAVVLDVVSRRAARARWRVDPEAAAAESSLSVLSQRVANLEVRAASAPGPMDAQLQQARREKESLESRLVGFGPGADANRAGVGFADVAAALPDSSTLVSFASFERVRIAEDPPPTSEIPASHPTSPRSAAYVAIVLRSRTSVPEFVPLASAARVDSLVERYDQAASRPPAAGARSADDVGTRERVLGTELRRAIWDPVRQRIGAGRRVFLVLDGALLTLNIAALPEGGPDYVVEHGPTLHELSSERDLVDLSGRRSTGHGLLAVGDPDFDVAPGSAPRSLPGIQVAPLVPPKGRVDCREFGDVRFPALPATRSEIDAVVRIWSRAAKAPAAPGSPAAGLGNVDFLSAGAASEAVFKREAPGHRILHLATHGFFYAGGCAAEWPGMRGIGRIAPLAASPASRSASPASIDDTPLLLSGLALAGANRRQQAGLDQDDGILTAEEIATLDLSSVEWAVVSACESGAGAIRSGEGLMGLRRAFQESGVRTTILSLWSIEDRSARDWMEPLYQARFQRGLDTADAVRAASLEVLADRRRRGLSTRPFYWGGFVASGDWR